MKLTEQEIAALEMGIAEDKARISYLEQRVKALEEALLLVQVLLIQTKTGAGLLLQLAAIQ